MKVKSSVILTAALALIETGEQTYACAAIQDVETQMRWDLNGENIVSKAQNIFNRFKPKSIPERDASIQQWWPKGAPERLQALQDAIKAAIKAQD